MVQTKTGQGPSLEQTWGLTPQSANRAPLEWVLSCQVWPGASPSAPGKPEGPAVSQAGLGAPPQVVRLFCCQCVFQGLQWVPRENPFLLAWTVSPEPGYVWCISASSVNRLLWPPGKIPSPGVQFISSALWSSELCSLQEWAPMPRFFTLKLLQNQTVLPASETSYRLEKISHPCSSPAHGLPHAWLLLGWLAAVKERLKGSAE